MRLKILIYLSFLATLIIAPTSYSADGVSNYPKSGIAREAGYEGHYRMPHTGIENDLAHKCRQAKNGIIMLDRDSLKDCDGGDKEPPMKMDHSGMKQSESNMEHNHSSMNHEGNSMEHDPSMKNMDHGEHHQGH